MGDIFDWERAATEAGMREGRRFNIASIDVPEDRALIWYREDESIVELTKKQVRAQVTQMAAELRRLGIQPGQRVAGLLSKRPESFTAALATWYIGAVYVPLFSGFSGDGIAVRLGDSGTLAVITDTANAPALESISDQFPHIQTIVVDADGDLYGDLDAEVGVYEPFDSNISDLATIMYTSGTTGKPKGCMMSHNIIVTLRPYLDHSLGLEPGETLFAPSDAGWSFGLFTTGLGPLSRGNPRVIYEGRFDPAAWWTAMDRTGAGLIAAAPTAYRQLAAAGRELIPSSFRAASSAGEPLDAAIAAWFEQNSGVTIYDCYGLSEVAMVVGNLRGDVGLDPVPGSMGTPVPGFEIELRAEDGTTVSGIGSGRLAIRQNGFFGSYGYWERDEVWQQRFDGEWFVTEDVARRDADGRYWFESRSDDVIVASGMNVGPAEVENALLEHPLIDDAGVAGIPDPTKGSIVTAHVVLNGAAPADLEKDLRAWVSERVGRHAAPRRVSIWDELPRTASGKLRRVDLRARLTDE
ncbi:MAG: acyl-CoA synthetase [Cumulibacter sp.]